MDDDLRALERAVRANPDDARLLDKLNRARAHTSLGFADWIMKGLESLGFLEHHVALALAMVLRDLQVSNWGVRVLISCTCMGQATRYGPTIHDEACRKLYATCRCFTHPTEPIDDDAFGAPNRYEVELGRERTKSPDDFVITAQNGEQVRAWCRDMITDNGARMKRWLEILATMRSRHVLVVDPADA